MFFLAIFLVFLKLIFKGQTELDSFKCILICVYANSIFIDTCHCVWIMMWDVEVFYQNIPSLFAFFRSSNLLRIGECLMVVQKALCCVSMYHRGGRTARYNETTMFQQRKNNKKRRTILD